MSHNPGVRFLVAAFALVALSSSVSEGGPPEPGAWIPSRASFVAFADVGALLSSPALEGLETILARRVSPDQLETFRELTGMDPWRDFHALSFFSGDALETEERGRGEDLWGLAASGGFDPERIVESLEDGVGIERLQYREIPLYVFVPGLTEGAPHAKEPHALAFPNGSTALFGPTDAVRLMLDEGFGFEPPSSAKGPLIDLDELSGCDALCLLGVRRAGLAVPNPSPLPQESGIPDLRSYSVSVRTGADIRVRARAEAGSSEEAGELADLVRGMFALAALSASGAPALESVEVETIDDRIEVSFELDSRAVRRWLRERDKAIASRRRRPFAALPPSASELRKISPRSCSSR